MSGIGFIVFGGILIVVGVLGFVAGQIILGRKKRQIKEKQKQIEEDGL